MAEENKKEIPFEMKMYQNKIPEVIVKEEIKLGHKSLVSLPTLMDKFPLVLLNLQDPSILRESSRDFFKKLPHPERLIVIAEDTATQIEFDLDPIPVLPKEECALLRLKNKKGVEEIVKKIASNPEFKKPTFEYLQILKDAEMGFQDLVKELSRSPELSEKILAICNTMERAKDNPFPNLARAVSFVGVEGVRQMLIEEAFSSLTRIFRNQVDRLCHLRRTSVLAGELGKLFDTVNPHIFWRMRSAALMHDLGALVLAQYAPKAYEQARSHAKSRKVSTCEAENLYLGINHQEAGLLMAQAIKLPEYLYQAISKHHNLEIDKTDLLLQATVIANGYNNQKMDMVGSRDYYDCLDYLEEAKKLAEKEKKDKEFAKLVAKLAPDDVEGRKKLEKKFYNLPDEPKEETKEQSDSEIETEPVDEVEAKIQEVLDDYEHSDNNSESDEDTLDNKTDDFTPKTYTSFVVEEIFNKKLKEILKYGYKLQTF